ncbi:unnamed protein product [Echinostoma caproni]|uniref:Kinesin-like protein n=1 Tax=Echinostoma caproni TaxID=27848 RepID=A0A183AFG6_9TREM|nr:unnamed protein product [Echinostoma caproni]
MNEHSSRSHSVFRICIQQNNRETGKQLMGSLYLVDLAGSEKVSKSGAEGSTLDEAKNINKSLSTLGNVINALVEGNTHIPYRDSKLTRILQQSLGGNSKTTIIIAASPSTLNETETKSTMVFGVRAKTIKNQITPNAQLTAEEWRRLYERETDRTKQLFNALAGLDGEVKRWRGGEKPAKENWYTEERYAPLLRELSDNSEALGGILSAEDIEMSDEERFLELFRLLDEKDDEINKQCQIVTKLEHQIAQTREDYNKVQRDNEKLQTLLEKAQHEADISRSEIKDVLQALEELAVTYDEKSAESKALGKELEDLNGRLADLQEKVEYHETEAADVKERTTAMRNKLHELIYNLNVQIAEVGSTVSKMFALKALLAESERQRTEREKQIAALETELASTSQELLQVGTKRQLCVELKNMTDMDDQLIARVQSTIERNAVHLQDQISKARGDTERAITTSNKLREENIILKLQLERFVNETDLLRRRLDTNEGNRSDGPPVSACREQAKSEIKAMEDTVLHELQVLNSLRRVFITDLKNRIRKNANNPTTFLEDEPLEAQAIGTALQRERIAFLRNSLDNLTRVHKQLVRDNADLRCDIPKLEKRVKASVERIRDLELALRETKEQMIRDKRRYHYEIERIKEVNWVRGNPRLRTNIDEKMPSSWSTKDEREIENKYKIKLVKVFTLMGLNLSMPKLEMNTLSLLSLHSGQQ